MRLERSRWDPRLQAMTSQELYYLQEMTKLTQSIGRKERVPPLMFPHEPPDSLHSVNSGYSEKRMALERRIWQQIQRRSLRFFYRDTQDPSGYAKHEGSVRFVVIWDYWQPFLKDVVCHQSESSITLTPTLKKQYLQNDSLDE